MQRAMQHLQQNLLCCMHNNIKLFAIYIFCTCLCVIYTHTDAASTTVAKMQRIQNRIAIGNTCQP